MFTGLPLFPEQASTVAAEVDALYFYLIAVSGFFSVLIATLVVYFAVRYRRRSESEVPRPIHGSVTLELVWTLIPLVIVLITFVWSARVYFAMHRVPPGAMEVYVVGKRWMWKVQHMTGQREINELHVPVGVPVKLILTSEDVIHSFFIPAFRIKKDAVPGRYNTIWFQATKPGTYHLFCAEYCGTKHSQMIGAITVLEPARFQAWLTGDGSGMSLASAGERVFGELACVTCHRADSAGRGPRLEGLFGKQVRLASGETVVADETYVRESILNPAGKVVAGYQPIMPTYQGLVSEEGLMQLVAYIQSLAVPEGGSPLGQEPAPAPPGATPQGTAPAPPGARNP
jgi:cytochrome c oxidase subunit 2